MRLKIECSFKSLVIAGSAFVATTPPPGQVCETRYDAYGQRYTVCR